MKRIDADRHFGQSRRAVGRAFAGLAATALAVGRAEGYPGAGAPDAQAITGSGPPAAAAMSGRRPHVIVLNSRDATVSLIDQDRRVEVGRVDVGKEPHHLLPTPDNRQLIVACSASDELFLLDPSTGDVRTRLRRIDDPYQLAFSPDQRWFVTAALRLDRLDIYRCDEGGKSVTGQMIWRLPVGKQPAGIIMSPDDQLLYIGIMGEDHVEVVDWRAQRSVARIRTGAGAHNFRGVGDGRHLLVSNRVAGTVSVIDLETRAVVSEIAAAGGPDCIELADDRRTLWVTTRWNKQVSVLDLPSGNLLAQIPVGRSPHGVYLHNRAPLI